MKCALQGARLLPQVECAFETTPNSAEHAKITEDHTLNARWAAAKAHPPHVRKSSGCSCGRVRGRGFPDDRLNRPAKSRKNRRCIYKIQLFLYRAKLNFRGRIQSIGGKTASAVAVRVHVRGDSRTDSTDGCFGALSCDLGHTKLWLSRVDEKSLF